MEQIKAVIKKMICISDEELDSFTSQFSVRKFNRQEIVCHSNIISDEIFFINRGLIRVLILDKEGFEQTIHFALENQFISDYSNFIQKQSSFYTLQAVEETEVVVLPRSSVEWGYQNLKEGEKMGRLIAEYYFIYQDNRIKNSFVRTPKTALRLYYRSFSQHPSTCSTAHDCFISGNYSCAFESVEKMNH